MKRGLWSLVLLGLAGCAAHRPPPAGPQVRTVELEALEVVAGGPDELAIADLNDSELFSVGSAAHAAGEHEQAARAFSRLVAVFPDSSHRRDGIFNAGLSWERMGEYLTALGHYQVLLDEEEGTGWRDAAFRAAECLYHLEDFEPAADLLGRVADTPGVDPNVRIEALVKEGVSRLEAGDEEAAETRLRKAVGRYHIEQKSGEGEVDDYHAAQGQFFLGELYRLRFERARLDPAESDLETLGADLEHKAALLLSAQGHYLRAIRMGHSRWATASGYRIGKLYEVLYDQMTNARLPTELADPAERLAYQELLREKIRILLSKAMVAYERTAAAAERLGVDGAWRQRVENSLERVREVLLEAVEDAPVPAAWNPAGFPLPVDFG